MRGPGSDDRGQCRSGRPTPQLQVPLVAGPRNHIDLGASPPDPLHTLSLGALSPRSGRVTRFTCVRASRRRLRPQTPYTLSRSALRRLAEARVQALRGTVYL